MRFSGGKVAGKEPNNWFKGRLVELQKALHVLLEVGLDHPGIVSC